MKREQFVIEANTIGELTGGLCSGQHQYRAESDQPDRSLNRWSAGGPGGSAGKCVRAVGYPDRRHDKAV